MAKNIFRNFKKTMISNNISFGAKFLSSSTIQKYDRAKNIFVDKGVSLCRLSERLRKVPPEV